MDILIILSASVSPRHIWSGSFNYEAVSDGGELTMELYLVVRNWNKSALFDRHLLSTGAAEWKNNNNKKCISKFGFIFFSKEARFISLSLIHQRGRHHRQSLRQLLWQHSESRGYIHNADSM